MVKPMGLDPSMSVLDLSAGLGGGARLVAQTFGVWVTGMESSKNLTELANEASEKAGMTKKAPIESCDLENLDLDGRSFDCIYARELFYTVKHKSDLFRTLCEALKTDAELAFTDFVLAKKDGKTDAIKRWIEGEPIEPHPWSLEDAMEILNELNLDVRVNENITDIYRTLVVEGLETIVKHVKKGGRVSADVAPAMLEEAELWGRRVEAFDSGDLKVYRFLARKPDMGQKGIISMSD
jgi:cyclopropane fatty-acyl-phospholipid synthase-like methyltransferase